MHDPLVHQTNEMDNSQVWDRLVDGELTDAEERALIAKLEETAGGWRRCALAFLEARCWQRSMTPPRGRHDPHSTTRSAEAGGTLSPQWKVTQRPAQSGERLGGWAKPLALAALLLLAFAGGALLPSLWHASTWQPDRHAAKPAQWADNTPSDDAKQDQRGQSRAQNRLNKSPDAAEVLVGNLPLLDQAGRKVVIPVYEWDERFAEDLKDDPTMLPPNVFQALKHHRVRSRHSYLPVRLQDGRQVVVPVQQVEVLPVRETAY